MGAGVVGCGLWVMEGGAEEGGRVAFPALWTTGASGLTPLFPCAPALPQVGEFGIIHPEVLAAFDIVNPGAG